MVSHSSLRLHFLDDLPVQWERSESGSLRPHLPLLVRLGPLHSLAPFARDHVQDVSAQQFLLCQHPPFVFSGHCGFEHVEQGREVEVGFSESGCEERGVVHPVDDPVDEEFRVFQGDCFPFLGYGGVLEGDVESPGEILQAPTCFLYSLGRAEPRLGKVDSRDAEPRRAAGSEGDAVDDAGPLETVEDPEVDDVDLLGFSALRYSAADILRRVMLAYKDVPVPAARASTALAKQWARRSVASPYWEECCRMAARRRSKFFLSCAASAWAHRARRTQQRLIVLLRFLRLLVGIPRRYLLAPLPFSAVFPVAISPPLWTVSIALFSVSRTAISDQEKDYSLAAIPANQPENFGFQEGEIEPGKAQKLLDYQILRTEHFYFQNQTSFYD
nr:hypothetical protein PanWU01x14_041970 [Ipomoea batatas]